MDPGDIYIKSCNFATMFNCVWETPQWLHMYRRIFFSFHKSLMYFLAGGECSTHQRKRNETRCSRDPAAGPLCCPSFTTIKENLVCPKLQVDRHFPKSFHSENWPCPKENTGWNFSCSCSCVFHKETCKPLLTTLQLHVSLILQLLSCRASEWRR